jgi:hypothetical protein
MVTTSKELSFDESIRPLMQYTTSLTFCPDKIFWEITIPNFEINIDTLCFIFEYPRVDVYTDDFGVSMKKISGDIKNQSVRKAIESLYYKHGLS